MPGCASSSEAYGVGAIKLPSEKGSTRIINCCSAVVSTVSQGVGCQEERIARGLAVAGTFTIIILFSKRRVEDGYQLFFREERQGEANFDLAS